MCGGGGYTPPPDNSAEVARIEAQQRAEQLAQEQERANRERAEFDRRLQAAYDTALTGANTFFSSRGVDPTKYRGDITSTLNSARGTVPIGDASPQSYFDGIAERIFGEAEANARRRADRELNAFAGDGFARARISDTADDPFLDNILNSRRSEASEYLDRLLERGVITNSGYTAGTRDLDRQSGRARQLLETIGAAELERGRSGLRDIAGRGRERASTLNLGDTFNARGYRQELDANTKAFFDALGSNLEANAPTDLFDTTGLANIAGAAQGAQNTRFDPKALAGSIFDEDDKEKEEESEDDLFAAF